MNTEEVDALQSIFFLVLFCAIAVDIAFTILGGAESYVSKLIRSFKEKRKKKEDHEHK